MILTEIWNRLSNLWAFISFIWSRIHFEILLKYVCKVYIHDIKVKLRPPPAKMPSFIGFKGACLV